MPWVVAARAALEPVLRFFQLDCIYAACLCNGFRQNSLELCLPPCSVCWQRKQPSPQSSVSPVAHQRGLWQSFFLCKAPCSVEPGPRFLLLTPLPCSCLYCPLFGPCTGLLGSRCSGLLCLAFLCCFCRGGNDMKEDFWRLFHNGFPTAGRLHASEQRCGAGCSAVSPGRMHHFWECPVAQAVVAVLTDGFRRHCSR